MRNILTFFGVFRNFIGNNYLNLKEKNPSFPFIVRECEGADPYVIARYSKNNKKI